MRRDPYFYVMIILMLPIFFTGTMATWMMSHFTFVPKSVPESRFYLLSYLITVILAITGTVVYLCFSKYSVIMFPVIILTGFIIGKMAINFISYRIFGEHYD
jgi:hypothetical protein